MKQLWDIHQSVDKIMNEFIVKISKYLFQMLIYTELLSQNQ